MLLIIKMIYEGTGGPGTWSPDDSCFAGECADVGTCEYSFAGNRASRVKYNNDGNCNVNKECQVPDQDDEEGNPCKPAFMTLKDMAIIYACGTVIMHIQTFLFTPFDAIAPGTDLTTYNVFKNSIIGRFFSCGNDSIAPSRQAEEAEDKPAAPKVEEQSIKDSLLSLEYLSICVYCVILQTRMNSIPGWTFTWLQNNFGDPSDGNNPVSDPSGNVDICMTIFGFMFFASVLISPIPSMVIKWRTSATGSIAKGKIDGLTFLFAVTTALGLINSIQMCFTAESSGETGAFVNGIAFVILYQFMRNFFFVSRSVFLYAYFPVSHFSILLGVSLLPIIASTFLIKVFYAIIMGDQICDPNELNQEGYEPVPCKLDDGTDGGLRDPTVYEYDFMPINAGFAGACVVAFYQLFYNIYLGKKLLRQAAAAKAGGAIEENEKSNEAQLKGVEGVTTEDERNVVDEKGFDNTAYATTEVKETNDEEVTDTDL